MKNKYWYLVRRIDGKEIAVAKTRHEAVGVKAVCHSLKPEWVEIVPIRPTPLWQWTPRQTTAFEPYRVNV